MEDEVKGIGDYLDIIRRRYKLVIYPAIFLILVSAATALMLPATYKSSGLILIESQDIPNDLVRTTVTSYADQRIAVIKQKLMTTSKVMSIVKKYDLYSNDRQNSPVAVIVSSFRGSVSVDMVSANVTDPRSGRSKRASIAFNVSFMDENPVVAQKVASELVTEFLNENVKTRTARAAETRIFLRDEGDKFQRKVQLIEKKIADFKDDFRDSLPELLTYNLSMVERLQQEQVNNQNKVMVLKDQILTMSLELANLEALYRPLNSQQPITAQQQLTQAKAKYTLLQGRYSPNHPDIKQLKRQIAGLEEELQNNGQSTNKPLTRQYKSPISLKINSKMDASAREIRRLHVRQREIKEKLVVYEKRVAQTHQVKRAYDDLSRDHANNLAKYRELRAKELQAELAENLESENKGESFTLIEPPSVASKPEKPNRPKIFIMGAVASIGFGLGLALLYELLVGGVRGYSHFTRVIGSAPLVVVPMIVTKGDNSKRSPMWDKKIYLAIGVGLIVVVCFHFLVMDLEILWFKVLRKISLL